jgi:hypothetical protein
MQLRQQKSQTAKCQLLSHLAIAPSHFLYFESSGRLLRKRLIRSLPTCISDHLPHREPSKSGSYYTFPRALEEEPHDEHLQPRHCHYKSTLHQAEVEDALLGALDSAEVAVLACAEVFLIAGDGGQLCGEFEDGLFENGGLFRGGALLGGDGGASCFVFDLQAHGISAVYA